MFPPLESPHVETHESSRRNIVVRADGRQAPNASSSRETRVDARTANSPTRIAQSATSSTRLSTDVSSQRHPAA
jgi:hypothetical protein